MAMANRGHLKHSLEAASESRSICHRLKRGSNDSFMESQRPNKAFIGLLLVALLNVAIAASSGQLIWRQQQAARLMSGEQMPQYKLLPNQDQRHQLSEAGEHFEFADKNQEVGNEDNDEEIRQFLDQLITARKQLDQRLANNALEQEKLSQRQLAVVSAGGSALSPSTHYSLLNNGQQYGIDQSIGQANSDSYDSAKPLNDRLLAEANLLAAEYQRQRQAESEQQPASFSFNNDDRNDDLSRVTANQMLHYLPPTSLVSQDGPEERPPQSGPLDADFAGEFGAPLRQPESKRKDNAGKNEPSRWTSLLEDEKLEQANETTTTTTEASYGRIVVSQEEQANQEQPKAGHEDGGYHIGSMFKRVYNGLNNFWNYWTGEAAPVDSNSTKMNITEAEALDKQTQPNRVKGSGQDNSNNDELVQDNELEQQQKRKESGAAKQDVSEPLRTTQVSEADRTLSREEKPTRVNMNSLSTSPIMSDSSKGLEKREKSETDLLDENIWPIMHNSVAYNGNDKEEQITRVYPVDSPPPFSKYVYAPAQHYYLSGPAAVPHHSQQQQHYLKPGDQVLSSFEPAYAFQRQDTMGPFMIPGSQLASTQSLSSQNTKPANNDLYFLIMVGAFCVMAMAVVLAAGLFAYRVQQQRKPSQMEAEYPTYGVVGPNNISAKCGAASLVGGYFSNNQPGYNPKLSSSTVANSKSASAKHLADLYSNSSGAGLKAAGSDTGLASLDSRFASSGHSKKSSTASCDQQQHCPAISVAAATVAAQAAVAAAAAASNGNGRMANNQDAARMYHYQHQKQQMIVSDRNSAGRHTSASDLDSEDENDDGSYTVYECPGLASAHEMEIKNPLFNDERTP